MIDLQKYITNGTVERTEIALDIKRRTITSEDLPAILNNPEIKAAFFGQEWFNQNPAYKIPKEEWTELYLNQISCAAIAECFNADYLRYLNEVAEYVHTKKASAKRAKLTTWTVAAIGAIAVLILAIIWLLKP